MIQNIPFFSSSIIRVWKILKKEKVKDTIPAVWTIDLSKTVTTNSVSGEVRRPSSAQGMFFAVLTSSNSISLRLARVLTGWSHSRLQQIQRKQLWPPRSWNLSAKATAEETANSEIWLSKNWYHDLLDDATRKSTFVVISILKPNCTEFWTEQLAV